MLRKEILRSKVLVLGVAGALALFFFPREALTQAEAASGSMMGFIYGEDMKTPVEKAVVKIRNVENGKEYKSEATDQNGMYAIKDVEEGRYDLGVSSPKGDFNFDYQIVVKAKEIAKLALALKPGAAPAATAKDEKDKKKKGFFLTPLGIAIIIAAAALLVYGSYKLFFEEAPKSPSKK